MTSDKPSRYANTAPLSKAEAVLLETPGGRENDHGAADEQRLNSDELERPGVGAVPVSTATAHRQPGMGAEETEDGLSDSEEALRHAAVR